MPRLEECLIEVDLALAMRDAAKAMGLKAQKGNLKFRCAECKQPVKPHKLGEGTDGIDDPHFEHIAGYSKPYCSLRHRNKATKL